MDTTRRGRIGLAAAALVLATQPASAEEPSAPEPVGVGGPTGALGVRVVDNDGLGGGSFVKGYEVRLRGMDGSTRVAHTDENGRAAFHGLPHGRYTLDDDTDVIVAGPIQFARLALWGFNINICGDVGPPKPTPNVRIDLPLFLVADDPLLVLDGSVLADPRDASLQPGRPRDIQRRDPR